MTTLPSVATATGAGFLARTRIGRRRSALIVRLKGGLGNQLFEYASAWAIAQRNGAQLCVDIESGFAADPYRRNFALNNFALSAVKLTGKEAAAMAQHGLKTEYLRRREQIRMQWLGEYHDPSVHHLRIQQPILLDNYLQSPLYFSDCDSAIRTQLQDIQPDTAVGEPAGIGGADAVCIHVRRKHGLTGEGCLAAREYYGAYSTGYYRAGMEAIRAERPAAKFFFFGDDGDWIRDELLPFCPGGTLVQTGSPIGDFRLMTSCTHFIIANSTFSWWAAWLGMKAGSMVCCGTRWNQGERCSPKALFPVSWRRISCQE